MVATDLDGTLLDSARCLHLTDRETLRTLGAEGVVRVVATGRSLHSALQVLPRDIPIDFLVFASGAGIVKWSTGRLVAARHMDPGDAREASRLCRRFALDFSLHHPVPENHRFHFFRSGRANPDFDRRCRLYRRWATAWDGQRVPYRRCSQLLVIEPPGRRSRAGELGRRLSRLHVVRTTSPLDGRSRWTEIFPAAVSKSSACAWLARRVGIHARSALAVGNDYNDADLLAWAGMSCVVANGPIDMARRHHVVASHDAQGFSEAVRRWLSE